MFSSLIEYYYDTDYLTQKPNLPRYEYDLDVLKSDGTWQPWVGTWFVNKQLNKKHPERSAALAEIQRLIETLAEEGPRPSFIGRFVRPQVTRVLLRGSPENPRDEVMPGGPAEAAGLQQGDLLVEVDGMTLDTIADFQAALAGHEPGDEVGVKYLREGEELTTRVTLAERKR